MISGLGHKLVVMAALLLMTLLYFQAAHAQTITGYDVTNAEPSGFGNWSYTYTGTITPNGGLVNLQGGSGSMNNGVIETSVSGTQLFSISDNPIITLYLDGGYTISDIALYGGDIPYNSIPGNLTGWTVGIGASSQAYSSTAFGSVQNADGVLVDDRVTLGASQSSLPTTTVVLSNFTGGWYSYMSIAEIEVNGSPDAPVPEPATMLLLGSGMVGLVGLRKRMVKK